MIKLNEQYRHRMIDRDIIHRYIIGGRGIVTLEAPSGKSHTYAFKRPVNASEFPDDVIFVYAVHDKEKLFYIGMMEGLNFRLTHNSRFLEDTEIVRGAQYIVKMASYEGLAERSKMNLYHEGICCRCGRPLTSQKSVEEGAGPKCLRGSFLAYAF